MSCESQIPVSASGRSCEKSESLKWSGEEKVCLGEITRGDLEVLYESVLQEKSYLKGCLKDQQKEIKRLSKAVKQKEKERKRVISPTREFYMERVSQLELTKQNLEEKVFILKHQLQSHSSLYAKAHRFRPVLVSNTRSSSQQMSRTIEAGPEKDKDYDTETYDQDIANNDARLLELQSNMGNDGDAERVAENIEIIRLRRLVKRQAAQLTSLTAHSDIAEKEISQLREATETITEENDDVLRQLASEKQKVRDMQNELLELGNLKQDIRVLQEQVRDLQNERLELRNNNEKLLEIASRKSEEDPSRSKSHSITDGINSGLKEVAPVRDVKQT